MYYKKDFDNTKMMFEKWWKRENERPLLHITARKSKNNNYNETGRFKSVEDKYLDYKTITDIYLEKLENHEFLCESYPHLSGDIGPGSLAIYIGSRPVFKPDTIWFEECINEIDENFHIKTDLNNKWFKTHLDLIRNLRRLSKDRYVINIPDLIENIDIYSAMRGAQNTCFDLIDHPEFVLEKIREIDSTYFDYYNCFHNEVEMDGYVSYTAFRILGKGKVSNLQCDFSAMMSPEQFRKFVVPSMKIQLEGLDKSLYHLDGLDAVKHLDAILEFDKLDALQWVPGVNYPDSANEKWYDIYDKAAAAGKCLWIKVSDGDIHDWIQSSRKLINRYGCEGLYLLYPIMSIEDANRLIDALKVPD